MEVSLLLEYFTKVWMLALSSKVYDRFFKEFLLCHFQQFIP